MTRSHAAALAVSVLLASCAVLPAPRENLVSLNARPVPAGATITVVTSNVLHGFGDRLNERTLEARLGLLARALDAADPDVILLQEVSLTPSRKHGSVAERLRDLLNETAPPGEACGSAVAMAHGSRLIAFFEGSAILSRYGIESAETIGYRAQSRLPPERRIALRVVLRGERGPVEVVSTHLTNVEARRGGVLVRELQARELVDRMIAITRGDLKVDALSRRRARARLLAKVHGLDLMACPRCGSRMAVIAVITEPVQIRKIIGCLERHRRGSPPRWRSSTSLRG